MQEEKHKKNSPMFFIIIGLIYLINPFDFPGPVDDLIVNLITCGLAVYAKKACTRIDKVVQENTGVCIDSQELLNECVNNHIQENKEDTVIKHKSSLEKMEDIFTNATK